MKEKAVRAFRSQQYGRTNQFDVQKQLDGLDEKFRVRDREGLADALSVRLGRLEHFDSRWRPEILSLFLELSDRPLEKTNIEALKLIRPPSPEAPITWEEILEDDPLTDDEIWKDVDYAAESSEDEYEVAERTTGTDLTEPTSDDEVDRHLHYVARLQPDIAGLKAVEDAQFWRKRIPLGDAADSDPEHGATGKRSPITELQIIREALFMLNGLNTRLFPLEEDYGDFTCDIHSFDLTHAATSTIDEALAHLTDIGSRLNRLRRWTGLKQTIPLLQTFQASILDRIRTFDLELAALHQRFIIPSKAVTVSLLEIHAEVRGHAHLLLQLGQLVQDKFELPGFTSSRSNGNPFVYLEALYEITNNMQMVGDDEGFNYFAKIFFESLQTYVKPVRRWMDQGELDANDEVFFVQNTDHEVEKSSLWHDRHSFVLGTGGTLLAPSFIHPAAQKVLNTGKSVSFLKELGVYDEDAPAFVAEPKLDYNTVCGHNAELRFTPFPELFNVTFDKWIQSKYNFAAANVRQQLESCGLSRTLDKFEVLYFASNGALFQDFADAIFDRLDRKSTAWNDHFVLTDIAQEIYYQDSARGHSAVKIRTKPVDGQLRSVKSLAWILVDYHYHWAVANIIGRSSLVVYQRIYTLLLQLYRAKYLLQRTKPSVTTGSSDRPVKHLEHSLRYRLLWFVDILRSHLTETVLAVSTRTMRDRLDAAEDIDAMAAIHVDYVSTIESKCMLAENLKPIYQAVIILLDLCVAFADETSRENRESVNDAAPPKNPSARTSRKSLSRFQSWTRRVEDEDEDDPAEHRDSDDADTMNDSKSEYYALSRKETIRKMSSQFESLCSFITNGLRAMSRASPEPCWEMLAERLEWKRGNMV